MLRSAFRFAHMHDFYILFFFKLDQSWETLESMSDCKVIELIKAYKIFKIK